MKRKKQKKVEPLWCNMYRDEVIRPQQKKRITEQQGRTEASRSGFYNTSAWKVIRDKRRRNNQLCQMCEQRGFYKPMTVVDHIIPVEEAPELALDYNNTQSLCDFDHSLKTKRDAGAKKQREKIKRGNKLMKELEEKPKG